MQQRHHAGIEWLTRLLLMVGSSLVGLYAVEFLWIFLEPTSSEQQSIEAAERLGVPFDTRTMSEFIRDMSAAGREITPAFSPEIWLSDFLREQKARSLFPLSGVSNILTAGYNENGDRPTYLSDKFGFNNPDSTYEQPIDIALIGDSYTAGITVQQDKNIAAYLRAAGHNVLNLGANANGPLIELGTLVEYAQSERPPVVIWLFYEGNDLYNLGRERQHPVLMRYLENAGYQQNLRDRQSEIDEMLRLRITALEQEQEEENRTEERPINILDTLKLTKTRKAVSTALNRRAADNIYEDADQNIALFAEVLARADEIVDSWDGKLYFVYLPMYQRFSSNKVTLDILNRRREAVLEEVSLLGIQPIDMAAQFEQTSNPLQLFPFGLFGHYNADGYEIVADEILDEMSTELPSP